MLSGISANTQCCSSRRTKRSSTRLSPARSPALTGRHVAAGNRNLIMSSLPRNAANTPPQPDRCFTGRDLHRSPDLVSELASVGVWTITMREWRARSSSAALAATRGAVTHVSEHAPRRPIRFRAHDVVDLAAESECVARSGRRQPRDGRPRQPGIAPRQPVRTRARGAQLAAALAAGWNGAVTGAGCWSFRRH